MFDQANNINKSLHQSIFPKASITTTCCLFLLFLCFFCNSTVWAQGLDVEFVDSNDTATSEAGDTTSIYVRLTANPEIDTTVSVSSSDPSEGTVDPTSLVFSANNWDIFQMVVVTGVDDDEIDDDVTYQIQFSAPRLGVTVSLNVINNDNDIASDPIDAVDDSATTELNTPVTIDVLENDVGCTLNIVEASGAAHGAVAIDNNNITYTPDSGFIGTDSFTYTITNCDSSDSATVTITVIDVVDPVDAVDDSATTQTSEPVTINVLSNDNGDNLSVTAIWFRP